MDFAYSALITTGLWIGLVCAILILIFGIIPLVIIRNRYLNLIAQSENLKKEIQLKNEELKDFNENLVNSKIQEIITDFGKEIKIFFDLILNNLEVILLKVKFTEAEEIEFLERRYEILNAIENCINQVNYFTFSREVLNSTYLIEVSDVELVSFFKRRTSNLIYPNLKVNVYSTELEIYGQLDINLLGILTRSLISYALVSSKNQFLELIIRISIFSEHKIFITFQFNSKLEYKEIYTSMFERSLYSLTKEYNDRNHTPVNLLLIKKIVQLHDGSFVLKEHLNETLIEITI